MWNLQRKMKNNWSYIQKIDELIQQEKVPECLAKTQQCKKCAYYEYCYI